MTIVFLGRENKRTGLPFYRKSFPISNLSNSVATGVEEHAWKSGLLPTASSLSLIDAWLS